MRIEQSILVLFAGFFLAIQLSACSGTDNHSQQDDNHSQQDDNHSQQDEFKPEIGMICVRGDFQGSNEILRSDSPVHIQLYPKGCFSSSCTVKLETSCLVTGDNTLTVTGLFRLTSTGDTTCTPDCNGGGFARCDSQNLTPGDHMAKVDDLIVNFSVPSTMPGGGICAGSSF